MVALAVVTLVLWVWYFVRKVGVTTENVMAAALWAIPMGIIVSRLIHVVDKYDYYFHNPGDILGFEGLTIYGAILGGLLGGWIYCRLRRLSFAPLADLAAPGIIVAQAIGRVGCILNGCCYGKPTSLPWGFIYPRVSGEPVHPTQLYELLGDLIIFALLFWVFRGRLRPSGSLLAVYLALYSALTFTVRFWRGDTEQFLGPLQEGQLIAILVFIVAGIWLATRTRWGRKQAEQDSGVAEEPVVEGPE
jgi:phosphatidylglycerol:prolipoprotein diacylglycerol transferase